MDLDPLNIFLINQIHEDFVEAEADMEVVADRGIEGGGYKNPLEVLSEQDFVRRFRLTKNLTQYLIELLTLFMVAPTRRSALSIERKVLVTLRFFASGGYQEVTGSNVFAGMSQASVSVSIQEVIMALNAPEVFNQWVRFPGTLEDLRNIKQRFFNQYGMRGIVGLIDCTHIGIVRPTHQDPEFPEYAYVNRKGYHSINVQLICDEELKVLNVNARFPGSVHDARIWRESGVSLAMEQLYRNIPNEMFFLLGDSGYPLRPWLITPFRNAEPGSPEDRFNTQQKRIRSGIERCNGVLKNRFRCLLKDRTLHYQPEKASLIINACIVLHNICIEHNIELLNDVEGDAFEEPFPNMVYVENQRRNNPDLEAGRALRNHIVNEYFVN